MMNAVCACWRGERLVRWVFLLGRLAPLSQATLAMSGGMPGERVGIFAVLAVESLVLLPFAATTVPDRVLVGADTGIVLAIVAYGAFAVRHPGDLTLLWGGLLFVVSMSAVLLRDWREAVALAGFWVAAEVVAVAVRFGPAAVISWRQLWEAMLLPAFMLLLSWLAITYRRINDSLDRAREHEVAREAALAAELERGRQYRILHDRVLQTMDTLARGRWIADRQIQDHVQGEARWLRQLISGELDDQPDDLNGALRSVIDAQAAAGLTVELHAGCSHPPIAPEAVEALSAAASEALTNVRKHAGVDRAVVSVLPAGAGVLVTVVDDGRGFDPDHRVRGLGIRQSVHSRMRQVAGSARLDTAPGRGTHIELWAPAADSARAAVQGHPR